MTSVIVLVSPFTPLAPSLVPVFTCSLCGNRWLLTTSATRSQPKLLHCLTAALVIYIGDPDSRTAARQPSPSSTPNQILVQQLLIVGSQLALIRAWKCDDSFIRITIAPYHGFASQDTTSLLDAS
ncbi:hypothetical protein BLOT_007044 [Blomia tropicalis]|nr:hypothetical protein BLOT_007044 [Blomia tropicalis]